MALNFLGAIIPSCLVAILPNMIQEQGLTTVHTGVILGCFGLPQLFFRPIENLVRTNIRKFVMACAASAMGLQLLVLGQVFKTEKKSNFMVIICAS